jgi:2-iminoacetate synthase
MRVERLGDLAAPLTERDGFREPYPRTTFAHALAELDREVGMENMLDVAHEAGDDLLDRVLATPPLERTLADFPVLLSHAGSRRIDELARAARSLTLARFGRTMHMYAPLYLSNECLTTCAYCGFARTLPVARKTLGHAEALDEARHLLGQGFRSLLLLTGEHERLTGVEFLERHIRSLSLLVPSIAIEVQVWGEADYLRLGDAGCEGVVIYQETYHPGRYGEVHLAGRKRDYRWRLLGPERAARAGMRRVGVGALLGLHEDWRHDAICTAAHARFLMKHHWRSQVTVSVPRIRPSASGFQPRVEVSDRDVTQLACALRLFLPDAGLVLSTREAPELRDGLHRIGITHTSAGSHTEPGGYEHPGEAEEQFEVADHRSPGEVAASLRAGGYEPVWEDPSLVSGVQRGLRRAVSTAAG